jgi:drug/metabolite transporter (DMT)-like permease
MCYINTYDTGTDIEAAWGLALTADRDNSPAEHDTILNKASGAVENNDQPKKTDIYKARALILLVATLYGTNFPLVKMMGENLPLSIGMTSTLRFGLSAMVTSPWLFSNFNQIIRTWSTSPEAAAMLAGFEIGLWNLLAYTTQAVGLKTTLASKSAFFCSLAVVVVPLLDFFFKGRRILLNQIVGLVLAIVGVGVLELGDLDFATGTLFSRGDLISLIQAFAFGMGIWRMEAAMQKYPNHALRATAAQQSAVFLGCAVFATVSTDRGIDSSHLHTLFTSPMLLAPILWTGIVTTALCKYMETVAIKSLAAAETTLFLSTEPVSGSLFAAVLTGERFGLNAMIGSGLILVSCITSTSGFDRLQRIFEKNEETTVDEREDVATVPFIDA